MTVRMSTQATWPNPSEVFALNFGGHPIPLILIAIMVSSIGAFGFGASQLVFLYCVLKCITGRGAKAPAKP